MGTRIVSKQIGEHTYKLETFGALQGMRVALVVMRFLGPTLAEALGGNSDLQKAAGTVRSKLAPGAPGLVEREATGDPQAQEQALADLLVRGIQRFAETAKEADLMTLVDAYLARCKLVQPLTLKDTQGVTTDIQLTATNFDAHFAGRWPDLVQWLVWCTQENFGSFFAK